MKFKTDKTESTHRHLRVTDKEGVVIEVSSYNYKEPFPICIRINDINDPDNVVGLTRSKALKLAWAIIDELNPSVL